MLAGPLCLPPATLSVCIALSLVIVIVMFKFHVQVSVSILVVGQVSTCNRILVRLVSFFDTFLFFFFNYMSCPNFLLLLPLRDANVVTTAAHLLLELAATKMAQVRDSASTFMFSCPSFPLILDRNLIKKCSIKSCPHIFLPAEQCPPGPAQVRT